MRSVGLGQRFDWILGVTPMPIEFDMPKGQMSIHANPRFRAMSYEARVRVISAWVNYYASL